MLILKNRVCSVTDRMCVRAGLRRCGSGARRARDQVRRPLPVAVTDGLEVLDRRVARLMEDAPDLRFWVSLRVRSPASARYPRRRSALVRATNLSIGASASLLAWTLAG